MPSSSLTRRRQEGTAHLGNLERGEPAMEGQVREEEKGSRRLRCLKAPTALGLGVCGGAGCCPLGEKDGLMHGVRKKPGDWLERAGGQEP